MSHSKLEQNDDEKIQEDYEKWKEKKETEKENMGFVIRDLFLTYFHLFHLLY